MKMEIKLKTLTPLWTGGVNGTMDRIHETGIIGSLRWWYEVIVRGLGGSACDPTHRACFFDIEKYRKSNQVDERVRLKEAGLCDVCQIFGATGWQRRFKLKIKEAQISYIETEGQIRAKRSYRNRKGEIRIPTWYFPHPARSGNFNIHIQSLFPEFQSSIIVGLFRLISYWGSLGTKAQMGFGIVEMADDVNIDFSLNWIDAISGQNNYSSLPSLKNIFSCHIKLDNATTQETFNIKYDIRRLFSSDKNLRHFIMGTVTGKRIGTKIKVSRPYSDGKIRIWGWIPEEAKEYDDIWSREKILNKIYNLLDTNYQIINWREMNSPRDTILPNCNNPKYFLESLLKLQEETNEN